MEQGFPILPMGKVWSTWTSWVKEATSNETKSTEGIFNYKVYIGLKWR